MNRKLNVFLSEQENLELFINGEQYLSRGAEAGRLPEESQECPNLEVVEYFLENTGNTLERFRGYLHLKLCANCREYAAIYAKEKDIEQQYAAIAFPPLFRAAAFAGGADIGGANAEGTPLEKTVEIPIKSRPVTFVIQKQVIGDGSIMNLVVYPIAQSGKRSPIPRGAEFCYNLFIISADQVTPFHKDTSEKLEIVLDRKEKYILFIGDVENRFVEIDDSGL
jgi:hypothetical protein